MYIYWPSVHQDICQKIIKYFSNYIPNHILANIVNDENLDVVYNEIVNDKDFKNSDIEMDTIESIEE